MGMSSSYEPAEVVNKADPVDEKTAVVSNKREETVQALLKADLANIITNGDFKLLTGILRDGWKGYDHMDDDELLKLLGPEG
jgi:hypothetical protein